MRKPGAVRAYITKVALPGLFSRVCHIYGPYPDAFLRQLAAEQLNALPGVDRLQAQAVAEATCASLSHGRFCEIKRRG